MLVTLPESKRLPLPLDLNDHLSLPQKLFPGQVSSDTGLGPDHGFQETLIPLTLGVASPQGLGLDNTLSDFPELGLTSVSPPGFLDDCGCVIFHH